MQICLTIILEAGLSTNILTVLHYLFFIACYNKISRENEINGIIYVRIC